MFIVSYNSFFFIRCHFCESTSICTMLWFFLSLNRFLLHSMTIQTHQHLLLSHVHTKYVLLNLWIGRLFTYHCTYNIQCGDGSATSSHHVSEIIHLETFLQIRNHQILQLLLYLGKLSISYTIHFCFRLFHSYKII